MHCTMQDTAQAGLAALLAPLAREIAHAVVAELTAGSDPGWVDQAASPLGRRLHIRAVRRRTQAGQGGAAVLGRRYLLSRSALDDELAATGRTPTPRRSRAAELEAALERGSR